MTNPPSARRSKAASREGAGHASVGLGSHGHKGARPDCLYGVARLLVANTLAADGGSAFSAAPALQQLRSATVSLANRCLAARGGENADLPQLSLELRQVIESIETAEAAHVLPPATIAVLWHHTAEFHALLATCRALTPTDDPLKA